MSALWNRKAVAQAWARRSLPSSLANVTWIDFTLGFSAFLLVAVYEFYRRSQPQTLVVEQVSPEPAVDMLWHSVAHIPSVEAFHDTSNVIGMQQQINKCINEIASLASLSPESATATASLLPSLGHKAAFVVLCSLQLSLCLYTAFFISKRRGTIKDLYYDVKDVTESVEEAYYLINELNSRVAQTSAKDQTSTATGVTDAQKDQLIADVLSKMEDRFTHPIEAIKTRLNSLENNVASLQRATNSSFNPRAPPYRGSNGGSKLTRDPRGNENFRNGDFRSFDSRNNDSRFAESNYLDSRPWKPWNRTGGRSHVSSTPSSAPIDFYGEKRSFEKMEWADKPNGVVPTAEPTTEAIQSVALAVSSTPVPTTITGAPAAASTPLPAPKLVVNCTPQQSKKIIIKAGDREYDLASAEGREQWSSVAKRNIAKAMTTHSAGTILETPHVEQVQDTPPQLAPLRTTKIRTHTIELSPLTSTYSSETDGTEASKASKPKEDGGAEKKQRAVGLDNYIESVGSPQSPNASLSRALQLKLEENVSKEKESSSGSIGDVSQVATGADGEKKPYRRLFIPGRGWVSARRIAMEKAQEEQGGEVSECERQDVSPSVPEADVEPTAGENTAVAA